MPNIHQKIFESDSFIDRSQSVEVTRPEAKTMSDLETVDEAETKIWHGLKLEQNDRLESAIACYREAIKLDPQSLEAHQILAVALRKQGKAAEASLYHRKAIALRQDRQLKTNIALEKSSDPPISVPLFPRSSLPKKERKNINNDSLLSISHNRPQEIIAKLYLEQALAYGEAKEWSKGIAACQQALKLEPNLAEAYKIWGNILQKQGKTADALGYYAKAVYIQPDMAEIYANLGSLYAKKQRWQQAIAYYQQSLNINPQCAGVYRNLAKICEANGEIERAWQYLFKAFELEPETISAEKHFQLAEQLWAEGKHQRAIACYRYAVTVDRGLSTTYLNLARSLERKQQWEAAKLYYQQLFRLQQVERNNPKHQRQLKRISKLLTAAQTPHKNQFNTQKLTKRITPGRLTKTNKLTFTEIELKIRQYLQQAREQPNSPQIQIDLGSLYARKQHWQAAIFHYQKAIELDRNCALAYRNLSKIYRKIGDPKLTTANLYCCYQLESSQVSASQYFQLGRILFEQEQIERSIVCYRQAIAKHPRQYQFYLYLAKALIQAQKWQQVVDCYRQLISFKSDLWEAHHGLGDALDRLDRWEESIRAYERAIELNPRFSWSYNNLGDVLLKLNRWKQAVDYFEKAIELNPEFAWSYYNLGEVLGKLGRWDEAYRAYKRSRKLDSNLPNLDLKLGTALTKSSESNSPKARQFYQKAIENNTDNEEIYLQLIELEPDNYFYYLKFGQFLLDRQRLDEAILAYQTARDLNPNNSEIIEKLSQICNY
jgi:tetratricopeptide (TPR) repeat protein